MSTSPLWQLFLMRLRSFYREPASLFWVFAFPLLVTLTLGLAFKNHNLSKLSVAVADGPGADEIVQSLAQSDGLSASRSTLLAGREDLRRGRVALVVVPGTEIELISDPTQPDGRTAKLLVMDVLERRDGRQDTLKVRPTDSQTPGSRYIDFLIPGLLGFSLMSSGFFGVGFIIVQMRSGNLLKRFVATPMRPGPFLLSFAFGRALLALAEIGFFLLFARLLFDVRVFGNLGALVVFALLGAFSFTGLALLLISRTAKLETASGLLNVASMPMTFISGVFFSADHFPAWAQPVIKALPLTALNDGLRALMTDGLSITSLWPQVALLCLWGVIPFAVAVRIFRWI